MRATGTASFLSFHASLAALAATVALAQDPDPFDESSWKQEPSQMIGILVESIEVSSEQASHMIVNAFEVFYRVNGLL